MEEMSCILKDCCYFDIDILGMEASMCQHHCVRWEEIGDGIL